MTKHLCKNENYLNKLNKGFLSSDDIKENHSVLYWKIKNSLDWTVGKKAKEKCFCGGDIYCSSWINDYGILMQIKCDECGFIWDEY